MICLCVKSPLFYKVSDNALASALAYSPGCGVNHDHQGGSPRVRLIHCTSNWLTPTIATNVGNLVA